MKQENKKYKNKQMRAGFTLFELMFAIILIIGLGMIAVNKLGDIKKTDAMATMMADMKNAQNTFNNIIAMNSSKFLKEMFNGGYCILKDTDDNGKTPTNDNEIKCLGSVKDEIKTAAGFKKYFGLLSVSEGDGIQVGNDVDCDYEAKIATGNKDTATVIEYKGCTYSKPKILQNNNYSQLKSFIKD